MTLPLILLSILTHPVVPSDSIGRWSDHAIIDIHGHIGSFKGYDLNTATLLENIDRFGLQLVLVSNIDGANLPGTTQNLDEVAANAETAALVRKYPNKLRGLVWTRPNDGKPEKIEPFLKETIHAKKKHRIFVGMKLHPMMNQFPADTSIVDGYLALCEKYNIPAVFHSDKPGTNAAPEKISAVARRHPRVPIILYHMTFFGPHESAISVVKESLRKKDARLYLETAQAKTEDVLKAIRELGSERVLFGTDATYFGKQHYEKYEQLVDRLRRELSPADFANVMHKNAERLFPLQ